MAAGERNQNMAQKLTVVVTKSTGKQGGAVLRSLLERGHKVRAVTRDPNSSQAKLLANAGAALVAASLEDTAAAYGRKGHAQKWPIRASTALARARSAQRCSSSLPERG